MSPTILYGYWRSGPSWRVRIALALKGVAYEARAVNLLRHDQRGEDYRAINPQGRIPTLLIDGLTLTQAPAILEYLEETRPEPPLLPRAAADRARVRALCALVACDINPLHNLAVNRALRETFRADDDALRAWNVRWIADGLAALDALTAETAGEFLAGDRVSLADIHLVTQFYAARRFGVEVERWPRLLAVEARALSLPAFADTRPDLQPDAVSAP